MAPLSGLHGEPRFWTQSQCRVPPTHWRSPCFSPTFVPLWGSFIRICPHGDLERMLPSRTGSGQLRSRCLTIPEHSVSLIPTRSEEQWKMLARRIFTSPPSFPPSPISRRGTVEPSSTDPAAWQAYLQPDAFAQFLWRLLNLRSQSKNEFSRKTSPAWHIPIT